MRLSLKRGILIAAFFTALIILAVAFKPDTVKADEGSTDATKIIKVMDFDKGATIQNGGNNLLVKAPGETGSYTVVTANGDIATIDNSKGEIETISAAATSSGYGNYFVEQKTVGDVTYAKIVNCDGTKFGSIDNFYKDINFVGNVYDATYYYIDDNSILHVETADGNEILSYDMQGAALPMFGYSSNLPLICKFGDLYVVCNGGNNLMILNSNGVNVAPQIDYPEGFQPSKVYVMNSKVKANYICVCAVQEGANPSDSVSYLYYFDKNLNEATGEQFAADSYVTAPDSVINDYNGLIFNNGSEISKVVPEGFNYASETTINGVPYGTGTQYVDGKMVKILYDLNGNILMTSTRLFTFAGSYFTSTDSNGVVSIYKIENTIDPVEVIAEAAIEGFDAGAKVVDADGNPVELDQVTIKAVQAAQETVTKAKAALAEKGVVIPNNAHVSIWDVDLTDADGNVVRLTDGSVRFYMPAEKGYDATNFDVKAYHVFPDGSCEEVKTAWVQQEDGTYRVQVTATSFSPYVVVYSEKSAETPSTGDSSNIMMPIILGAAAVAALGITAAKKRQFD
ncbi:MAG: hypothetical protein E7242_06120 [Lachnospiraceae bacterium]|nr:hypothetical protein [Lachnospiraceae bacterium]